MDIPLLTMSDRSDVSLRYRWGSVVMPIIRGYRVRDVLSYSVGQTPMGEIVVVSDGDIVVYSGFDRSVTSIRRALPRAYQGCPLEQRRLDVHDALRSLLDPSAVHPLEVTLGTDSTELSMDVWESLRSIPEGTTVSYTDVARVAQHPRAVRAVASAVGRNPFAPFIPCHRVIRSNGSIGGYYWGTEIKLKLLQLELAPPI